MLTTADASITDSYVYDGYGEELIAEGSTPNPFRYGGEFGYYYDGYGRVDVRLRSYEPGTGRWISQDPIGFAGEDLNLYRYTYNDPTNWVDPAGTKSLLPWERGSKYYDKVDWFYVPPKNPSWADRHPEYDPWSEKARRAGGPPTRNWPTRLGSSDNVPFFLFDASSAKYFCRDIEKGWYPAADGLNPFGDPYKDMGYWNEDDSDSQWSYNLGRVSQQALLTAATSPQAVAGAGRAIGNGLTRVHFAERLFQSRIFGVASSKFGSSGAGAQGAWNVPGRALKAGWSGTGENGGGMVFRLGRGVDPVNANRAAKHTDFMSTFVPNNVANPIMQAIRNAR
jgi:RHS repeat-associated protein